MARGFFLGLLCLGLVLGRQDAFLRLCHDGDEGPLPDCVHHRPRQEIRQLSDEERTWVVEALRKERAVAPRWDSILDPPAVYHLIRRLDARLGHRHLSLPYWDSSVELRLPNPGDSSLFHSSFLTRSRQRRHRRPAARPKGRIERRIRSPRHGDDKSIRRTEASRMRKLIKAIKRSKESELLFLLFQMGEMVEEEFSLKCPSPSPFILCPSSSSLPYPMLSPASRCPSVLPSGICHSSHCISGYCTIVMDSASLRVLLSSSPPPPVEMDNSTGVVDLLGVEGVERLDSEREDEVTRLLADETTTTLAPPTTRTQNGWYRHRAVRTSTTAPTTTQQPRRRDKIPRQAPLTSNANPIQSTDNGDVSTAQKWKTLLPFPTVYVPITVIDGPWRGIHRIRPVKGASAFSVVKSSVHNTVLEALEVPGASALFLVRTANPEFIGPVVETHITVTNHDGKRCEQLCLNLRKNSYKHCQQAALRLSVIPELSDDIAWSNSESEAISSEWSRTGYYQHRKLTHVLFSC